jgi:hypothetical protein
MCSGSHLRQCILIASLLTSLSLLLLARQIDSGSGDAQNTPDAQTEHACATDNSSTC